MSTLGEQIMEELKANDVKFYVTVPDSLTRPLWSQFDEKEKDIKLIKVCHEAEAVAVGAGIQMGGSNCVVVMENAGFFQAIEALRALPIDMKIPLVMLVSWVGRLRDNQSADDVLELEVAKRGGAATHIALQGALTEPLVRTLDIPYATLEGPEGVSLISWAFRKAHETRRPVAVLLDSLETVRYF